MAPPPRLRVLRDALPLWWRVARQWFTGASSRRSARSYAALCTALAAATTMLSVRISYAQRRFSTALAERNADAWHAAVLEYVCIILVAAPLRAVDVYVEKRLIALWRASLTGALIQAYCSGRVYFHMQLARGTEGIHPSSDDAADSSADAAAHDASVDDADRLEAAAVPRGASCTLEMAPLHGARVTHAAAAAAAGHSTASTSAAAAEGQLPGGGGAAAALAAGDAAAALVDNPDQRITADVANFVSTSVSLVLLLIKKLLNCAAFAGAYICLCVRKHTPLPDCPGIHVLFIHACCTARPCPADARMYACTTSMCAPSSSCSERLGRAAVRAACCVLGSRHRSLLVTQPPPPDLAPAPPP